MTNTNRGSNGGGGGGGGGGSGRGGRQRVADFQEPPPIQQQTSTVKFKDLDELEHNGGRDYGATTDERRQKEEGDGEEGASSSGNDGTIIRSCHDAIMAVGSFGRYQYYTLFVLQYSAIVGAGITYMQITVGLLALGRSLGFIIGGHIADYLGRKKALYTSQFGVCIISTLSIGCQNWIAYGVCIFLTGIMWGMGFVSAFVLSMECTDWSHRWIINAANQKWIQYCIVALIAYVTGDWRRYLIIINVLFAPLLIFFLLFRESPRFLIYHQRLASAAHTLTDIGSDRWNNVGREITEKELKRIPNNRSADPQYPLPTELFRGWWPTKVTLTLMLGVCTASGVSNFYIQNAHPEAGNPFLNIAMYGLIRMWVPFVIVFLDYRYHSIARRPIYLATTLSVLICTCVVAILEITGYDKGVQRQIFALVGASLSEALFMCINQSIVEIYPTAIRGIAIGWIMSVYGLGGTGATIFRYLETHGYQVWHPLPYVSMTVISFACLITGIFGIPETKHKPMEDSLNYSDDDRMITVTNQNRHKFENQITSQSSVSSTIDFGMMGGEERTSSQEQTTNNNNNNNSNSDSRKIVSWDTKFHY